VNNLETISFDAVINSRNVSYADWRRELKPVYKLVWIDIFTGYLLLALTIALSTFFERRFPKFDVLNFFLSALFMGFLLAYLALFIHEAGHYNIHPDKKKE
jgi:hypothetical protein